MEFCQPAPSACARGARVARSAQRQECSSLTLLLLSERAPSSWRDCGCTWALGTRSPRGCCVLSPGTSSRFSARGEAQMHCLHCCETPSALGDCCFSSLWSFLSQVCITELFSFCSFSLPLPLSVDCHLSHFTLSFSFAFSCLMCPFTSVSFCLSRPCPLQPASFNTGDRAQPLISVRVFLPTVYKK